MKWIKTFEELRPDTYRRAGNKLISIGHSYRGGSLVDYSHEKESGLYNMLIGNDRSLYGQKDQTYSYSFSRYKVIYGSFHHRSHDGTVLTDKEASAGLELEESLENWKNGDALDIEIMFYFKPTSVTRKSLDIINYKKMDDYPLFSIKYTLALPNEEVEDPDDISTLYEENEWLSLITSPTNSATVYGIFSDKKSAILFMRSVLPRAIDSAKEKLADLYSAIAVPTEYYEKCIDGFKKITNNHLYRQSLKDNLGNNIYGDKLIQSMYCEVVRNIHER